jgi:hypothetical protein
VARNEIALPADECTANRRMSAPVSNVSCVSTARSTCQPCARRISRHHASVACGSAAAEPQSFPSNTRNHRAPDASAQGASANSPARAAGSVSVSAKEDPTTGTRTPLVLTALASAAGVPKRAAQCPARSSVPPSARNSTATSCRRASAHTASSSSAGQPSVEKPRR